MTNGYMEGEPPTCEACGQAVERGQFVHCYDDAGEVHVNCEGPWATPADVSVVGGEAGPIFVLLGQPLSRFRVADPEAATLLQSLEARIEETIEWAFEKSRVHHRLAHENKELRTEHIASSTAYRELALELQARAALTPSNRDRM